MRGSGGRSLIAVSLVVGVGLLATGVGPGIPVLLAPAGVGLLGAVMLRQRSGGSLELPWGGSHHQVEVPSSQVESFKNAPLNNCETSTSNKRQVILALARAESREWLSNPWFAIGIGFCALLFVLFGWVFTGDNDGVDGNWRDWFVLMPIMAHPLVGMSVIAAHSAITRDRRSGAEELFAACPTDKSRRVSSHLISSWVPAVAMAVFVIASSASVAHNSPNLYGHFDSRSLADALTAIVLVVCGAFLGTALGRWAPWQLTPVIVVPALVPLILGLGNIGDPHWSNLRQLSSWPRYPDHDLIFTAPRIWWHIVWLAGLGALTGAIALGRERRPRALVPTAASIAALTLLAGIVESRPMSSHDAGQLASMVAEPYKHQTCRSEGRATACVYRGYEGLLERTMANIAPVVNSTPHSVAKVRFRQEFDGDLATLGPEVGREIQRIHRNDSETVGDLLLGYSTTAEAIAALRLSAGLDAVSLPTRPTERGVPLVIAGQARGVLALWLAGRGMSVENAQSLASHHHSDDDDPNVTPSALDLGMAWPDPCFAGSPPVAWSAQDLEAARMLMARPESEVNALFEKSWEHFIDPATTTDSLLSDAGLRPLGPSDYLEAVAVKCDWS